MYWAHSGLPTWVAHLGPILARQTLCFGSEVGHPSGAHKAVQMGPTWDPYRIPVGISNSNIHSLINVIKPLYKCFSACDVTGWCREMEH